MNGEDLILQLGNVLAKLKKDRAFLQDLVHALQSDVIELEERNSVLESEIKELRYDLANEQV